MNVAPRIQSYTCPCCRGFIGEAAPIEMVIEAMTSRLHRLILEKLSSRLGRPVQRDEIVDYVYRDDADGGPATAVAVLWVSICRLKPLLEPFGWTIERKGGGGRGDGNTGVYRLLPLEAGQ